MREKQAPVTWALTWDTGCNETLGRGEGAGRSSRVASKGDRPVALCALWMHNRTLLCPLVSRRGVGSVSTGDRAAG